MVGHGYDRVEPIPSCRIAEVSLGQPVFDTKIIPTLGGRLFRTGNAKGSGPNWSQTVPGKGWFRFRFYGQLDPFYEKAGNK